MNCSRICGRRVIRSKAARHLLAGMISVGLSSTLSAQEVFSLNAEGNNGNSPASPVFTWALAPWTGVAGKYPGSDDTNDVANVIFREFNNVDGTGDPAPTVDLGGLSYTIGTLNISESGTGNTDGNFANGTLNVSNINYTSGAREVDFEANLIVNGGASLLTINTTGGNVFDFLGSVTGTGGLLIDTTSNFVRFNQATSNWSSIGGVTLRGSNATVINNFLAGETFTIDALTINHTSAGPNGRIEIDRNTGSNGKVAVTGLTRIQPATGSTAAGLRFLVDFNDDNLAVDLNTVQLNNGGGGVELVTMDQIGTLTIAGTISDGGGNDVLTLSPHYGGTNDLGTFNINAPSTRTAATIVSGLGRVNLNADGGFGSGLITVKNNAFLHLGTAQSNLNIAVEEFAALGGNNTVTAGAITLPSQNAVLVANLSVFPTTTETGGAVHFTGITALTGTTTVGDDGNVGTTNDIYKGAAFGAFTTTGNFSGTINVHGGTANLELFMHGPQVVGKSGTATFGTTGVVNITGPGTLVLDEPDAAGTTKALTTNAAGGADVFNRTGSAATQNLTTIKLADANALLSGQTLNVTDGRFDVDNVASVQAGAIVNIGSGATLSLDQNITTGTYNVNQGAAISTTAVAQLNSGATINLNATNGLFIIDADYATSGNFVTLMQQMDVILHDGDADDIDGSGIVLGDGKRLATPSTQSVDLTGGAGVFAAPGATKVIFSASTGDTLDINDAVNLVGVDLQIGSGPFTTIVSGGTGATNFARAVDDAQAGTVGLKVTSTRSIDIQTGILRLEPEAFPALKDGSITTAVSGIGGATRIRDGARLEIEYNQETDPAGIQVNEQIFVDPNFDPLNSGGQTFIIDRVSTVTGGNNIINLNNIVVGNNAQIAVDVQDTTTTEGRLSLHLVGSATTVEQTSGADNADEFALKDLRGANADGTPNTTDPRTLNIGYTPPGTTPGSNTTPNSGNYVMIQSVYGTIDSNVTVNVINGNLDFQTGSVVNGTVNANTRTGDFFIRIRNGQNGSGIGLLTGTGAINMGHDTGTTIEDIAGFVDEIASGTGLYNSTDLRINILPSGAIVRAERGTDSTVNGTFHYKNVGLNESTAFLAAANQTNLVTDFVLNGNGIIQPDVDGADDAARVFVGKVTDPGTASDLRVRGTTSIRFIDSVVANNLLVGGTATADQSGRVIFQNSTSGSLSMPTSSAAALNLTGEIQLGQGGQIDANVPVTAGIVISGNGSLDINNSFTVPSGKRLAGANSTAILIAPGTGSLTLNGGAILAPGASPGTLLINGSLSVLDGVIYQYELGTTPATSDLVNLTGTATTVSFGASLNLDISNPGSADPTGQTYVLFNYTGADPGALPAINFTGLYSGTVAIDSINSQIVLTDLVAVPEPSTLVFGGLALLGFAGIRLRRR